MRVVGVTAGLAEAAADRVSAAMGELTTQDAIPPGPYTVGMTKLPNGNLSVPYTVLCGTGQAVAGHVPSAAIAGHIAMALNTVEQLANAATSAKKNEPCDHDWETVNPRVIDGQCCLRCGAWK